MKAAGIGSPTGLETEERGGLLPSRAAKAKRYRGYEARWNAFDTALISIGQGLVMVTPLQAANIAAAFANGGVWYKPHLLDRVTDRMGRLLMKYTPQTGGRLPGSPQAINTIRRAMFKVVNDRDGSGRMAFRPGLEIYGKTGSAESGPRDKRIVTTWFIAFVKYKNKTYASALVYEVGRSGGSDCAPLTGAFFERFLLKDR
jgi:penicillin-binding protein 2